LIFDAVTLASGLNCYLGVIIMSIILKKIQNVSTHICDVYYPNG